MKLKLTILAFLLFSIFCFSQNGINYKALIKDVNGNVLANEDIQIRFSIIRGSGLLAYQETQSITTDNNGLAIAIIGEGAPVGGITFDLINWSLDSHELAVSIDLGSGFISLGSSSLSYVPYAKVADNVNGLEAIDEGNGIGWRLIGSNPYNYGTIGLNAVDFSSPNETSSVLGATGDYSFASGRSTEASGFASTAMGIGPEASASFSTALGSGTVASGNASTAIGSSTIASGGVSTAMGSSTEASGDYSTAMGLVTNADAYASTAIGRFNVGGGSVGQWNDIDPLFEIGNGTSNSNRSNVLTVYKYGYMILNSSIDGLRINSEGTFGITIDVGNDYGVFVNGANVYGGFFQGNDAAIFAEANINSNPDIILGGDSGNSNDDGIIASDPLYTGSDIYLRSNDAVVIQLDYDDSSTNGGFIVRNSDGDNVFTVNENGNANLAGSLNQNSDRRLKQDIADLPYGLNEILQLQPKAYHWRKNKEEHRSLGLIAQDVQPIISEIVNTQDDKQKTLGISYTELIPVLIKAIQEQQDIIDSLKSTIQNNNTTIQNQNQFNTKQSKVLQALLSRVDALEQSNN